MTRLLLSLGAVLGMSAGMAMAADAVPAKPADVAEPKPYLLEPGEGFTLLKNWTFGNKRPDATIRDKADLDREFYYRYIWEGGTLDKFDTYWSYHRDYPEADARSLHVFDEKTLTLKGRIPPGGGLRNRGIESGMLRAKLPITPGMYMEMRAKLPGGVGVWPNFWLEQGVQYPDGTVSPPAKVMSEIDIFEFFNWDGRPETRIIVCNTHSWGGKEAHGNPHDIFTTLEDAGYERHLDLGFDCSKDFHVFALDWVENKPIWLVDGKPIKQTYYEWTEPGAHLVVASSIGMEFAAKKGQLSQMVADEKQWDYVIDYIRIWEHKTSAGDAVVEKPKPAVTTLATPYPDDEKDWPGKGVIRKFGYMQGERDAFWKQREKDQGAIVFVGDSLTGGWKNLASDFPKLKVANRGVGGDTSRNVLFRFKEDVLALNPKAVVIEIGNNDLTAMGRPSDMLSNVAEMLAMAQKERPGMPVVLVSIPPSANPKAPVKTEDRKAMNEGLQKLASGRETAYFCDLYGAVANEDGSPNAEYFAADKLHMSSRGHSKWAELLMPIFAELKLEQ